MVKFPKLLFVLLVCLLVNNLQAQEDKLEKADRKFEQYAFIDAQKIYLKIADEGFESAELYQKLGDSYYFNGKYAEGAEWYGKLVEKFPEQTTSEYYFRYAQTLKALREYQKSDEIMSRFRAMNSGDSRAELFEDKPDYLADISYIDSDYQVENLRLLNSRYSDFGPTLYEGKLIFSSARDTGVFKRKIHKWNNQPFLDFYAVRLDEETGSYSKVERFGGNLNTPFHESTPVFTKDGRTIYFARNNYSSGSKGKDKNGTTRLKIYKATKLGDNSWTEPEELPFNNDSYSVSHPALSPDGNTLYFASDMPGTVGFSDLWSVSILADGTYGTPQNLGPKINTEGRENFPFISQKGNLYFSSDGRPGLGGLDIYVAARNSNNEITQIINLGEPVNSPHDDFSFIVEDAKDIGYFATNRYYGMGSDDIFKFSRKPKEVPVCKSVITGIVKDKETMLPLPTATVSLIDLNEHVLDKVAVDEEGRFNIYPVCGQQILVRGEEPYYYSAEELVIAPKNGDTLSVELLLEPRIKRVTQGDDLAKILGLNPIYFDFDRFNIRPDAALELTKIISAMEENPKMVVKIRSHTDSRGNDNYNLILSDKRARSTADYIVSRGIERDRISGEGFGEKELLNDCGNGADCTEEEHQLNRRSEFIVISF